MADTETWWPGVFRSQLHHVPDDAREFHLCGLTIRFRACNCPTVPAPGDWSPLDTTAQFCPNCLTAHSGRSS